MWRATTGELHDNRAVLVGVRQKWVAEQIIMCFPRGNRSRSVQEVFLGSRNFPLTGSSLLHIQGVLLNRRMLETCTPYIHLLLGSGSNMVLLLIFLCLRGGGAS